MRRTDRSNVSPAREPHDRHTDLHGGLLGPTCGIPCKVRIPSVHSLRGANSLVAILASLSHSQPADPDGGDNLRPFSAPCHSRTRQYQRPRLVASSLEALRRLHGGADLCRNGTVLASLLANRYAPGGTQEPSHGFGSTSGNVSPPGDLFPYDSANCVGSIAVQRILGYFSVATNSDYRRYLKDDLLRRWNILYLYAFATARAAGRVAVLCYFSGIELCICLALVQPVRGHYGIFSELWFGSSCIAPVSLVAHSHASIFARMIGIW